MRRCCRKEPFIPVNITLENTVAMEHNVIMDHDHIYNSIDSRNVPRKTSEGGRNFVQPNEQSYADEENNPPSYEASMREDRVTAFSTTSDIRAHQSTALNDDATKEYDYAYAHVRAHDDQGISAKVSADNDQGQGFNMNNVHSLKSAQPNKIYGVVNQPKCDGPDIENIDDQIHDKSNHVPTTYLPNPPLHTNSDDPNGGYGVINQHKSDDPNL